MHYLVLMYDKADERAGRSASEQEVLEAAFRDSDAALRRSGYLVAAELLVPEGVVTTVRVASTALSVGDRPVVRAPHQLRTVLTLQARDLSEAIQVVATMPQARLRPAEVWALQS